MLRLLKWWGALVTSLLCAAVFWAPRARVLKAHADPTPLFALARPVGGPTPYDAVYGSATHNSYWVHRDRFVEGAASGTQERILDQLLHEHVRALEFDVHFAAGQPGVWSVYHTDKESNSLCSPLSECLKQLQLFQYLVPQHEVVNVVIELKELWTHVFWPDHSIEDFDRLLRDYLGPALYAPRELLARCEPGATLRTCARTHGWPSVDELRGRFIVNVLGNWNYNANDWIDYATREGGAAVRAAFPMRSIIDDDGGGLAGALGFGLHDVIDLARLAEARAQSIFWQVEDFDFPGIAQFMQEHGVVRAKNAHSYAAQVDRIRRGFQLIQNDHPWHFLPDDQGAPPLPTDPSRRLFDAASGEPRFEPGERLYAIGEPDDSLFVATQSAPEPNTDWETAPSTTRAPSTDGLELDLSRLRFDRHAFTGRARARGLGCLRAGSRDGAEYFMVCRQVTDGERARVSVRWRYAGQPETVRDFDGDERRAGRVGDLIALRVRSARHQSCAYASSASEMRGPQPGWNPLVSACFPMPLEEQGLAATRDVLFVGTRRDGVPVRAAALVHRNPRGGALVDLSQPPRKRGPTEPHPYAPLTAHR